MRATALDDGVGCVSGSLIRLGAKPVSGGLARYPGLGDPTISSQGAIGSSGGKRYYQCAYRNADVLFCTSATTNRTNGLIMSWTP